jgi:hypothetical protein
MMGLKVIEVKKAPEEVRRRKAKTALKMGGEDNYFTWIGHGLTLFTRNPAKHLFRYPPGPV